MKRCSSRLAQSLAAMLGLWMLALGAAGAQAPKLLDFTPAERVAILRHGPWPPAAAGDPGNPYAGKAAAIRLGEQLFFDTRLSPGARVACASCHQPHQAFADGRTKSHGLADLDRNSPSLWNSVHMRWQAWDGAADSLWSQAIRPLLDPREMGSHAAHLRDLMQREPELACHYTQAFGKPAAQDSEEAVLVHLAQALGAFVATLVSPATPFDRFRDDLARGDTRRAARYPLAAQHGLRLFVGKANCHVCHLGPMFSNGEFADIGLPFFSKPGVVDPGRHGGIEALKASPYTRLSPWAAPGQPEPTTTRHVDLQPRNFGEFRVPSLRHVAQTAPYMHDGQLATLDDVVRHYDQINLDRLHADGDQILKPLNLSVEERAQLVAFLGTLTAPEVTRWQPSKPAKAQACKLGR